MRIYMDSNVFRYLKREDCKREYDLVRDVLPDNVFCFSEAHMYDLSRDKTPKKWEDLKFMESIAKDHCFYFEEGLKFTHRTPTDHFESYDWPVYSKEKAESEEGRVFEINNTQDVEKYFLLLRQDVKDSQTTPEEMQKIPELFRGVIEALDDYALFVERFKVFSLDQVKKKGGFKQFLKFLHDNMNDKALQKLQIEGHDGTQITDLKKFLASYSAYFLKDSENKNYYNLFTDMYFNLEIFGIFKGDRRKQTVITLTNDARHAYFGAFSDVIISADEDFVNKATKFYELLNIQTVVIHWSELPFLMLRLLQDARRPVLDLPPLLNRLDWPLANTKTFGNERGLVDFIETHIYYNYFDTLAYAVNDLGGYYTLMKQDNHLGKFPLWTEIVYIKNRLYTELGPDGTGRSEPEHVVPKGNTIMASWGFNDWYVEFKMMDGQLYVVFHPKDYIENAVRIVCERKENK